MKESEAGRLCAYELLRRPSDELLRVGLRYLRADCATNLEMAIDAMCERALELAMLNSVPRDPPEEGTAEQDLHAKRSGAPIKS